LRTGGSDYILVDKETAHQMNHFKTGFIFRPAADRPLPSPCPRDKPWRP
jgi:hypothetical protein